VFNLIFGLPQFWGRDAPNGSTMVPLGRELVSSHRLSVQTNLVFGTVWQQFTMQVLTGGWQPQVWGAGWSYGVGDGFPEYSPGMTSYRLPIVTIGLSLTVFAVLRMFQTDGRTDGFGLAIGGTASAAKFWLLSHIASVVIRSRAAVFAHYFNERLKFVNLHGVTQS